MDLRSLIDSAVMAYKIDADDLEILEWDGASPINRVSPDAVRGSLTCEGYPDCYDARVVLLRLKSLDLCLVVFFTHPAVKRPLTSDEDVELAKNYLHFQVKPALLASEMLFRSSLRNVLVAASARAK